MCVNEQFESRIAMRVSLMLVGCGCVDARSAHTHTHARDVRVLLMMVG